jgi:hypothetical protein
LLQARLIQDDDHALAVGVPRARVARIELLLEDEKIAPVMEDGVLVGGDPDAGRGRRRMAGLMTTSRNRPTGAV